MSINLGTALGLPGGGSISGAAIEDVLNNNDDIVVTQAISAESRWDVENPNLVLSGAGSIGGYCGIVSAANTLSLGSIVMAGKHLTGATISGVTFPQGLVGDFENCQFLNCVSPDRPVALAGSDNTIDNFFVDGKQFNMAFKFVGALSSFGYEDNPSRTRWEILRAKSSKNNLIKNSVFANGVEERVGYDSISMATSGAWGKPSSVNTGTGSLVLNPIGHWTNPWVGDSLVGSNSVGRHVLVLSGALRGRYYEVIAQAGATILLGDHQTLLAADLTGLTTDDYVCLVTAFVDNTYRDNIIKVIPYFDEDLGEWLTYNEEWTGIPFNLYGSCFGNQVINVTHEAEYKVGGGFVEQSITLGFNNEFKNLYYNDFVLAEWNAAHGASLTADDVLLGSLALTPNCNNEYHNVSSIGPFAGNFSTLGYGYTANDERVSANYWGYPLQSIGPRVYDSTFGAPPELIDSHGVVWENNTGGAPITQYPEWMVGWLADVVPGSNSSTTFGAIGEVDNPSSPTSAHTIDGNPLGPARTISGSTLTSRRIDGTAL